METKEHKEIKEVAFNYLINQGFRLARIEKECDYHGRADVWGINFSSFYTKIIEVKVSRSDFNADKFKRHRTKNFPPAEEVYYICPSGLIKAEEVGDSYGLLWYNGNRIINKKKAPHLKVPISTKLRILIDFLEVKSQGGYDRKATLR